MLNLPAGRSAATSSWFTTNCAIEVPVAAVRVLVARYGHACNLLVRDGDRLLAAMPFAGMWKTFAELTETGLTDDAVAAGVSKERPTILVTRDESDEDREIADLVICGNRWHSNGLYDGVTVASMAAHAERLLRSVADDPETPVALLEIVPDDERRLLLHDWNGTPRAYPDVLLHELFEASARSHPEAIALEMGSDAMTYLELDRAANRMARRLQAAGIRGGAPVLVDGPRSFDLIVAIYAVWKAGGALFYADPLDPQERIATAARIASVEVALAASPERWRDHGFRELMPLRAGDGDASPVSRNSGPEDAASIIFTSGSTGEPKGVVRSHRMLASRLLLEQSIYRLAAGERHLLKSPISARETVAPLMLGHTAVIADPGTERDDVALMNVIASHRISVISIVPSMLRALAASPAFATLRTLRYIFAGGEALDRDLEDRVREALGLDVHNTYTLTEADYVCSRPRSTAHERHRAVIGRPTDMRIYICDEHRQLVPAGVAGEIYTGGTGLATGYAGRPDLTQESFVSNPFEASPPVLFRTGDLARFLPDGQLEYAGRADDRVKIRGLRVEPAEVEAVLRAHPLVTDAAVVSIPDVNQGARLIAFVVSTAAAQTLRAYLSSQLPRVMVPSRIEIVTALPLLKSGKVDRAALRKAAAASKLPRPTPERLSPTEERVAALWSETLPDWRVSVDEDFMSAGGDSLRLVTLRGRLEQQFDVSLSLAELLESGSISRMAAAIDRARSATAS